MMGVEEQIAELGVAADHADVIRTLLSRRSLETACEGGYISVRPPERHIGAFFNKRYVDVATRPEESANLARPVRRQPPT